MHNCPIPWDYIPKSSDPLFCATGKREPAGRHAFDRVCHRHDIADRLIEPRTNRITGRFNGHVAEVVKTTVFRRRQERRDTLLRDVKIDNQQIPRKALGHVPPIQALKQWQTRRPDLFKKRVYNPAGRDIQKIPDRPVLQPFGRVATSVQYGSGDLPSLVAPPAAFGRLRATTT